MRLRLRSFGIDYVAVHDSLAVAVKLYDKLETSIDSLATSPRRGRDVVSLGVLDGRRDLADLLVQRAMGDVL